MPSFVDGPCRDLTLENVVIPRLITISICIVLVPLCVLMKHYRYQVHSRILWKKLPDDEAENNDFFSREEQYRSRNRSRMMYALAGILLWSCCILSSLQIYTTSTSIAFTSPRMVFSFTTTAKRIEKIRPTIDSVLVQEGRAFDRIYVVIPRIYRHEKVQIPSFLITNLSQLTSHSYYGITYSTDIDYGPASKVLGTLLVEQDPDTIIVYADDDRQYFPQLTERVEYYTKKYPNEALASLGGWLGHENALYCGRSLKIGVNRISVVGGAGAVVVYRKHFGMGKATLPAFEIVNRTKYIMPCYLGDDYYLSLVLSQRQIPRRLLSDSCWTVDNCISSDDKQEGLSKAHSLHIGGPNVYNYQQCIKHLGNEYDLSNDGEFGGLLTSLLSQIWGLWRIVYNGIHGQGWIPC